MAERSETEFFVCMTQDALPADRQLLEHLLAAFEDETVGAAYARQLAGEEAGVMSARPTERARMWRQEALCRIRFLMRTC